MAVRVRLPAIRQSRSVGFRRILVPLLDGPGEATQIACRLAADRGAVLTAVAVVEVPRELPLDAAMEDDEAVASDLLRQARAQGDRYGVAVELRLIRARDAGQAIVEEAARDKSELIVLEARRRRVVRRHGPIFTATAASVLTHAPCRVLVTAPRTGR